MFVQRTSKRHYYFKTFPIRLIPYTEGRWTKYLFDYELPKETVAAITMLYKNAKSKTLLTRWRHRLLRPVLLGDTLTPYLFIICLDYVPRASIDLMKENGFMLAKKKEQKIHRTDYTDDILLQVNTRT